MLKVDNIRVLVSVENQRSAIIKKTAKRLKIKPTDILDLHILKRSIDARRKPEVYYTYSIACDVKGVSNIKGYTVYEPVIYNLPKKTGLRKRPVIVGFGPAGLFAAYILALTGENPLIIERGKRATERKEDVEDFFKSGILRPESNVQFGEGGAGTFSDGKLNTTKNDRIGRNTFVLETFVKFGASPSILYDTRPHIGTDRLIEVVENIRNEIIRLGGEVRFNTCLKNIIIDDSSVKGIVLSDGDVLDCDNLILAIGHSARDTFKNLYDNGISMNSKPFAVGFRIEHPQEFISYSQYSECKRYLPPANYKIVTKNAKRPAYSFCMCPGGYVINASSEENRLCVNGMSEMRHDGRNANSAFVTAVGGSEFDLNNPLSGMEYQRSLEEKAYRLCNGRIPQQLYSDFKQGRESSTYGSFSSSTKGVATLSNLRGILSDELENVIINGIDEADRYIHGFAREDMILSGIESRTSSPIRINRRPDTLESENVCGLYPCGEGAGYAGGITSAAMDGIKVAEKLLENQKNR